MVIVSKRTVLLDSMRAPDASVIRRSLKTLARAKSFALRKCTTYREAIDVLLSLAVIEKLGSALILGHLKSTRNKLAATFSPSDRHKIRSLRRRILIGPSASREVMASYSLPAVRGGSVNEAFFEMRRLELVYLDANGRRTAREVEPQFLYLSWPVRYLLAWDQLRKDMRTFRVDRIAHAAMRADGFAFRPEGPFLKAI